MKTLLTLFALCTGGAGKPVASSWRSLRFCTHIIPASPNPTVLLCGLARTMDGAVMTVYSTPRERSESWAKRKILLSARRLTHN
jgi:hypothetical protein